MKKLLVFVLAALMVFGVMSVAGAEKAPEEYTGTLTIYSPHDADPLNAAANAAISL